MKWNQLKAVSSDRPFMLLLDLGPANRLVKAAIQSAELIRGIVSAPQAEASLKRKGLALIMTGENSVNFGLKPLRFDLPQPFAQSFGRGPVRQGLKNSPACSLQSFPKLLNPFERREKIERALAGKRSFGGGKPFRKGFQWGHVFRDLDDLPNQFQTLPLQRRRLIPFPLPPDDGANRHPQHAGQPFLRKPQRLPDRLDDRPDLRRMQGGMFDASSHRKSLTNTYGVYIKKILQPRQNVKI